MPCPKRLLSYSLSHLISQIALVSSASSPASRSRNLFEAARYRGSKSAASCKNGNLFSSLFVSPSIFSPHYAPPWSSSVSRLTACFATSGWWCELARDESVLPLLNGGAIGILIFSTPPTILSILAASALLLYKVPRRRMKGAVNTRSFRTFLRVLFHFHWQQVIWM